MKHICVDKRSETMKGEITNEKTTKIRAGPVPGPGVCHGSCVGGND